jgi:hypothetical protein
VSKRVNESPRILRPGKTLSKKNNCDNNPATLFESQRNPPIYSANSGKRIEIVNLSALSTQSGECRSP